ncbi:hypothetical protein [Legionella sp. WA2022007384]
MRDQNSSNLVVVAVIAMVIIVFIGLYFIFAKIETSPTGTGESINVNAPTGQAQKIEVPKIEKPVIEAPAPKESGGGNQNQ